MSGRPLIALYVLDESRHFSPGGAQKWFLHRALDALSQSLDAFGAPLILRRGAEAAILAEVVKETRAGAVFWHRRYSPAEMETDKAVMAALKAAGVEAHSFNGALLREPWETATKSGDPYRVFTPFWNALRAAGPSRTLAPAPKIVAAKRAPRIASDTLAAWRLCPTAPNWAKEFGAVWRACEAGAHQALDDFLGGAIATYSTDRDRPQREGTSRLSPHLALGTISPLTIWDAVQARMAADLVSESEALKFLAEIAWREFSYHLLYHNPAMPREPLRAEFSAFPWRRDDAAFAAWSQGRTGVPVVDAGMRQLWRTGWMHNRVRMIAASYLVKNLLLPWQAGERWFWETLVDADPANNPASWQWVAGSGADAAPYFRIFNPVTQSEKFDPQGAYLRRYVPEIANLPDDAIHAPWTASAQTLQRAKITLGVEYPHPLIDLGQSRKRALAAYHGLRQASPD